MKMLQITTVTDHRMTKIVMTTTTRSILVQMKFAMEKIMTAMEKLMKAYKQPFTEI